MIKGWDKPSAANGNGQSKWRAVWNLLGVLGTLGGASVTIKENY